MVNDLLEGYRRIRQLKRHNIILEVSIASAKRGLLFIPLLNANIGIRC